MLNLVIKAAQIAAGVAVGCMASDAVDKFIYDPIQKVLENKKAKKKES